MYIYELPEGSEITIRSSLGLTYMEYKSAVVSSDEDRKFILIEPLREETKLIGFQAEHVINVVTAVHAEDKKVYIYRDIVIDIVRDIADEEQVHHRITTEENPNAINRRNNFRVFLGCEGVLQAGSNHRTYDVIVKDISAGGFGFLCKQEDVKIREGQFVHLVFTDPDTNARFSLNGKVLHGVTIDANTILFGCTLPKENDTLGRYVADKQRIKKK